MKYIDEMLYNAVKMLFGIALILLGILFAALGGWGIYASLVFGIIGFIIVVFTYFDARDLHTKNSENNQK